MASARWFALMGAIAAVVAAAATIVEPGRCADYPAGHRCDALGYTLLVVAIVAALLAVGLLVVAAVRRRAARHRGS